MAERLLTVEEAAELLECHVNWIYRLLNQGRLRYLKFGRFYQIYASSVRKFKPRPVGRPPVKKAHEAPQRALRRVR